MVQLTLNTEEAAKPVKVPIFIFSDKAEATELAELIVNVKPTKKSQVRIDLEPKRELELQKMNKSYSKLVFNNAKKLGRTKLIKMAIDHLINTVEDLPEEEAIEYLRTLYKGAEF